MHKTFRHMEPMETTTRRSATYEASIWGDDFVQSLSSPYAGEEFVQCAESLKREVKVMIDGTEHPLEQLQLIDNLQRLDISYHFHDRIQKLLDDIYHSAVVHRDRLMEKFDLYAAALRFRLLREHGYRVSQEVFCSFMDENGNFRPTLASDIKGILSLYEASFLSMEGEAVLDSAKDFAIHHLKRRLAQTADVNLADEIRHALELPLHWRLQKLEARWFMRVYEGRPDADTVLLQLAKLDYNMVQAKYQEEIKDMSRMILCKVAVLITIIDDIYDLHGTLDELKALTNAILRWDINELDGLPEYMRMCFLALFNSVNEMTYEIMRDQGLNIIPNLSRLWAEMCSAFNLEARWHPIGYYPGLNEYLNTDWISVSGPLVLLHSYLSTANPINMMELASLEEYPGIIRWPSIVFRLTNDLATATDEMKRGDAPSSIQCYMRETGCSEEDARCYIKQLIDVALKRMNKEIVMEKGKGVNESFCTSAMNLARLVQCLYQFGDGMGVPHHGTKRNLVSLIVEPIPIP